MQERKPSLFKLLPIAIFVLIYIALGLAFEFILPKEYGIYQVPIVVIFLISLGVAIIQSPLPSLKEKLAQMAKGLGDANLITMLIIFLEAGIFVGVIGRKGAENIVYYILPNCPTYLALPALFVSCSLVSMAMGTSVGTIALMAPIATVMAQTAHFPVTLCLGAVISGAMFGDNLSLISDTTIAACQYHGCQMKDKFRTNFAMAAPAALFAIIIFAFLARGHSSIKIVGENSDLVSVIPYFLVLVGGVLGLNVFIDLLVGIISGMVISIASGYIDFLRIFTKMGSGASGMFETSMVAILVSAICALIADSGGFEALITKIKLFCKTKRAGLLGIGFLVSVLDVATANNTVAIIIANPIAKELAKIYQIAPKKVASVLDIFSCVVQGLLPYGAQMLVALGIASQLKAEVSPFAVIPCVVYPFCLCFTTVIAILFMKKDD